MAEIADELRKACSGHPHAKIAWPHRLLHRAADELDAKDKRIAELEAALAGAAYIACLQRDDNSERAWFIVGWQGGKHSMPNNEDQAWLYRRGMDARIALGPREPTEADKWCLHFTSSSLPNKEDRNG